MLEILLRRGAGSLGGWSSKEIRTAILDAYELKPAQYPISALRCDLRKLRAHPLIERIPHTHRYGLTSKGQKVAILMNLLRKRVYGPLAASAFVHSPAPEPLPPTAIEKAGSWRNWPSLSLWRTNWTVPALRSFLCSAEGNGESDYD